MTNMEHTSASLAKQLKAVLSAAGGLAAELKQLTGAGRELSRTTSACQGGACNSGASSTADLRGSLGDGLGSLGTALTRSLARPLNSLTSAWQSALRTALSSLTRTLASTVSRAAGGGIFGGLLGGLVGGGLSALVGGLFKRKHTVRVDNTVRAEVLNFPRLSSLDYAANPASRLLAGRAVPRGPAFTVEVDYRGGAEDVVSAKVASRLRDLNLLQGAV